MTLSESENVPVNVKSGMTNVNGTQIYYEVQGSGPPVLFISGATGDAGHFGFIAPFLADEFTIVRYDRRGNSRSPRPVGWGSTSMDEQADDAAGLIKALGLVPCVVFGTSGGGDILLSLLVRHSEVLQGAILHEPALISALSNPQEVMGPMQSMVEEAMSKGGTPPSDGEVHSQSRRRRALRKRSRDGAAGTDDGKRRGLVRDRDERIWLLQA